MRTIRNLTCELLIFGLLLYFYLSSDVYNALSGKGTNYKYQLLVSYNEQSAKELNLFFIQLFVVIGIVIITELALWCVDLVKRKKNKV